MTTIFFRMNPRQIVAIGLLAVASLLALAEQAGAATFEIDKEGNIVAPPAVGSTMVPIGTIVIEREAGPAANDPYWDQVDRDDCAAETIRLKRWIDAQPRNDQMRYVIALCN